MGLRRVNFDFDLSFDGSSRRPSEDIVLWLLEVLTLRNEQFLIAHPDTPKLYDSGVFYAVPEQLQRQPTDAEMAAFQQFLTTTMRMAPDEIQAHIDLSKGVESFRDIPRILALRFVDCDNLACYRAAELRIAGVKAKPCIKGRRRENGPGYIYHALTLWPDGSDEDSSRILGMGGDAAADLRIVEINKNVERYKNFTDDADQSLQEEANRQVAATGAIDRTALRALAVKYHDKIESLGLLPKDREFKCAP